MSRKALFVLGGDCKKWQITQILLRVQDMEQ